MTASLGGMTAVEQSTEVDPSIDFGGFDDRPAADCQDPPRSESCLVGTRADLPAAASVQWS
jgi:hypothetical protein